jgi:hypothetical protein
MRGDEDSESINSIELMKANCPVDAKPCMGNARSEKRAQILAKEALNVGVFWQQQLGFNGAVAVGSCLHCPTGS